MSADPPIPFPPFAQLSVSFLSRGVPEQGTWTRWRQRADLQLKSTNSINWNSGAEGGVVVNGETSLLLGICVLCGRRWWPLVFP
mmetsp:Transcript_11418/g.24642  ORF Transcript_11418/g.24642 Transcript_11418/m.24642 type:complete len:84 (+) Transcript_11418:1349-1600(+)